MSGVLTTGIKVSAATQDDTPAPFVFDAGSEAEIERILVKYPPSRAASAVLPILYLAQSQMLRDTGSAWVSRPAMDVIAARLNMPPIRVYEVATFYLMFNTKPIGRFHLQVCGTTPCWLRGAEDIARACRDETGIPAFGNTSDDRVFHLSEVECLGACVNAPILQVDDDFYEDMDTEKVNALLAALRRGERPAPGSMIGRQTSAPDGGATTLNTLQFAAEG